jgi:hypothetical protein
MLDVLNKKVDELLGTLVDPIWKRILALSWISRFAILLLMLGLVLISTHLEQTASSLGSLAALTRVAWNSNSRVPLHGPLVNQVHDTAKRLATSLEADLGRPGETDTQVWPIAQAAVAANQLIDIDVDAIKKFMRNAAGPSCSCWRDFQDTLHPRNIPASGWTIFALAEIDTPATSGTLPHPITYAVLIRSGWIACPMKVNVRLWHCRR